MTNNEQLKKDRELLQNAYNDFLSICTRASVENSRTGTEAAIAFERVKNYSDKLLATQERIKCSHTLLEHQRMKEARASAEMEGGSSDKTDCQLIDMAKGGVSTTSYHMGSWLNEDQKRKVCKECQCESDPGLESHMAGCSQNMSSICSEHKMKMYGCAKCYPYLITN